MRPYISAVLAVLLINFGATAAGPALNVLFLGDDGHHTPRLRFQQLRPVLAARNITITYTPNLTDLTPGNLAKFDGLMIYANHPEWTPDQEKAVLDYVAGGKGFIPLHCASYCFIKSQAYVDLVGGQFRSHTTGVFRAKTVDAEHPIMQGVQSFESWDETYVHHKHNAKNRTVLEVRTDGGLDEPWTWVRTHGNGRVFYTAWGHDHRTWSHPGFHTLVERGIRWACNKGLDAAATYTDKPKMTGFAADAKPFEFVPATLPYYPPGEKWGTIREPIKQMQKPLPAAESLKHYTTPVGFEMVPFVTEEQLPGGKPIAMTWDERGRLWLSLTVDYPNELQRPGNGRDKIVVCEDTDRDGKCDQVTTFAEKLSIPTSLLASHGGLIVYQAPDTLFLKDTDGDGVADVRQVLFTGWGTRDTHAGPSNLRYGPDGWIYGMCGYSGFDGTVGGEKVKFGQGLHRFKLDRVDGKLTVSKLEFLRSTNNNSWGVGFNAHGELFGSTANGCPLVHLTIPNRYFEKVRGLTPGALANIAYDNHVEPVVQQYRQVDWHGGYTAGAGCSVYTAAAYPDEYRNKVVFVCEPTAHLVTALVLQPNGSSYTARYGWNLCASRDDWAAPIDAQVGPDGHVWVLDWYNVIVQHNPTPQGYKTGPGNAYETDLRDKKFGRVYRVVYKAAKPDVWPKLPDGGLDELKKAANHTNQFWQTHADRVLRENSGAEPVRVANDPARLTAENPADRLKGLLATADEPPQAKYGPLLAAALNDPTNTTDPHLAQAVTIAAACHDIHVLEAVAKLPTLTPEGRRIVELVARHYASGSPAESISRLLVALESANGAASEPILAGLAGGWAKSAKPNLTPEATQAVGRLLTKLPSTPAGRLMKLAAGWGVPGLDRQLSDLAGQMVATVADESKADDLRLEAARQAVEFAPESDDVATRLTVAVSSKTPPRVAVGIFEALANSRSAKLGALVVGKLSDLSPSVRTAALRVVLSRSESAAVFLDAVEKGTLRFDLLALDQKTALAAHPNKTLAERAKKLLAQGGGLPSADRQKVIHDLEPILKKTGDVGLGKKAFTQHCAKCHKHGGEGQQIGPDLTGFAVHPKEEILIHVLDPSRSVEGNYKAYTANLLDGRTLTGLLASETRTSIELLDAENKRFAVARDDIDTLKESPKSLMPEGFEKQMTVDELTNLLEFLTQKGKFVPIPLDKYATVVTTKGMFTDEAADVERLIFKDWKPKEFAGVPFYLVDPTGANGTKNAIMLFGSSGKFGPTMPKMVSVPCNTPAKAIHVLGGVGGWAFPYGDRGSVSVVVKLNYDDGRTETHELKNGIHIADYIRRVDVPQSKFAFDLRGQQVRYLAITPKRASAIKTIDFVKGPDSTVPVIMAVTVETP